MSLLSLFLCQKVTAWRENSVQFTYYVFSKISWISCGHSLRIRSQILSIIRNSWLWLLATFKSFKYMSLSVISSSLATTHDYYQHLLCFSFLSKSLGQLIMGWSGCFDTSQKRWKHQQMFALPLYPPPTKIILRRFGLAGYLCLLSACLNIWVWLVSVLQ